MAQYVVGWRRQLTRIDLDRHRAICDVCDYRNGVLDRRLALRQFAVCRRSDDVRAAIFQSILLSYDWPNLPRTDGHMPDFRHDTDHEHGNLPATIGRANSVNDNGLLEPFFATVNDSTDLPCAGSG